MGNLKTWLRGLIGGFIGAASNSLTNLIVDPLHFNPMAGGGYKKLGTSVLVGGVVGAALYLKSHPTPWDGQERRQTP